MLLVNNELLGLKRLDTDHFWTLHTEHHKE